MATKKKHERHGGRAGPCPRRLLFRAGGRLGRGRWTRAGRVLGIWAAVLVGGAGGPAGAQGRPPERKGAKASDRPSSDEALLREIEQSVEQRQKKAKTPRAKPASGPTRPRTAEDELKSLEKGVNQQVTTTQDVSSGAVGGVGRFFQSLNPNISVIGSFAAGYFYDGAAQNGAHAVPRGGHDPKETGFNLQEFELSLQAEVDPYFRFDSFFSFSTSGVEAEEGYLSTLALPGGLQFRAGYFNQKFGRQNTRHLHQWNFVDNMLGVVRFLGTDALRSVSFETSWVMPLSWYSELSVSISPATGEMVPSFVGSGRRATSFHVEHPGHLMYLFRLAQQYDLSVDWALAVGASYAVGPNASGGYKGNLSHLVGTDLFLKWRPLRSPYTEIRFTTEWYGRVLEIPEGRLFDWGLYAMLRFRVSQRWSFAFRYDVVDIEDAGRLAQFDFVALPENQDSLVPVDDQYRFSASLTWQPTEFSQIRLQYNNNWIRRTAVGALPGRYGQVHEVFLQLQANIGTHGAHPF